MESLIIARRDGVLEITLNDPENGNLVTAESGDAIVAALEAIEPGTKLVRFAGAGADFCRGRRSPPLDRAKATPLEFRRAIADGPLRLYNAFKNAAVPILGIVQGKALGVGCALAALCDVTLAADDAIFQVPELGHGIVPTLVMSALVGRVPEKAIAGLVLTRETIGAQKAEALGIVTRVVPAAALQAEGERVAASLAEVSAEALAAVKDYLRSAPRMDQAGATAFAANLIATVQTSRRPG